MADRKPLVLVSGEVRQIGTGDTVPAANGGTGQATYTVGDVLYANTTSTLARLSAVAVGNVLRSAGTGTAPAWGKVVLTTDVSGALPIANGGTAATSASAALTALGAVAKAGDTITGNVTMQKSAPYLALDNTGGGGEAVIGFREGGTVRWEIESTGSDDDLYINRFVGGVYQDSPIQFRNSSGSIVFSGDVGVTKASAALNIRALTGDAALQLISPNANANNINGFKNSTTPVLRWQIIPGNSTAEGGSNTGSDMAIARYSDAGASLGNALVITRSTGALATQNSIQSGTGFVGRAGNGGAVANLFNIYWNGSAAQLWIDSTNIGSISVTSDDDVKHGKKRLVSDRASYLSIEPISFRYKDSGIFRDLEGDEGEHWGFSAQNLIAAKLPKAVQRAAEGPDGKKQPMNVLDRPILAMTVLQVQELIKENEELRAMISDLNKRFDQFLKSP